jgi:peptidoglycan/LPS O-acetylase OafA/YrhL
MNWKALVIAPIAIYGTVSLLIVVLDSLHMDRDTYWVWAAGLLITSAGLYIAAKCIHPESWRQGILISLGWLAIFVVLDIILAFAFTALESFFDWKTYLPYALTMLIPLFCWKSRC